MITAIHELTRFLADWYECLPDDLAMPEGAVPVALNPDLRAFYLAVGALAEPSTKFCHPENHMSPLSAQDRILAVSELMPGANPVVFLVENQGNWVAAADAYSPNTLIKGDVGDRRIHDFEQTKIPLVETLCGAALMETIISVAYQMPRPGTDEHVRMCAAALTGRSWPLRTVHADGPLMFFATRDLLAFGWTQAKPEFVACRGVWRTTASNGNGGGTV